MQEFVFGIEETRYATIAIHADTEQEANAMLAQMLNEAECLDDVPGIEFDPELELEYGVVDPDDSWDDEDEYDDEDEFGDDYED